MTFRHQHSFHLSQHSVRIRGELERVRQQHDVDAVSLHRQILRVCTYTRPMRVPCREGQFVDDDSVANTARAQKIGIHETTDLNEIIAEQIRQDSVKFRLLEIEQTTPEPLVIPVPHRMPNMGRVRTAYITRYPDFP